MNTTTILDQLRANGFRITVLRQSVVELFLKSSKPMSAQDFLELLRKKKKSVNKTSVYREIEFLLEQGLIRVLQFQDRKKYYEWNHDHHHHLICRGCSTIEDIELNEVEKILPRIEKKLASQTQFARIEHSLEFFGLCKSCL